MTVPKVKKFKVRQLPREFHRAETSRLNDEHWEFSNNITRIK